MSLHFPFVSTKTMELATQKIKLGKGMPSKNYKNYKIKLIFNDYHGEANHTF
jgi:hypothetical protein